MDDGYITIKIWNAESGKELLAIPAASADDYVGRVALSPDGGKLAASMRELKIWDVSTGQEVATCRCRSGWQSLRAVFSPDSKRLAASDYENHRFRIRIWNAMNGDDLLRCAGHASRVSAIAFRPDGTRLASASEDSTIKIWNALTGAETATLKGHTASVTEVVFSPDGKRLASCDSVGAIKIWDSFAPQEPRTFRAGTAPQQIVFNPGGKWVAGVYTDGIAIYRAERFYRSYFSEAVLKTDTGNLHSVVISADGKRVAAVDFDNTIKVWDITTGKETRTFKGHTGGGS